ncbi:daunorubicin resistance protein DrrA family ABC transporter ATP-binding protein [Pseudonocardia sulfidoxydans NBRC 16205]|uniref:Daunorubicin resistance protein DrrA family ABC transporter ATP-binding protein n=1 Tax=Pseudonocardia sulfidoxydans NBRC 16205 TaxID=1223511 RepID=A0A511DE56_9PSEU|nr:ATP-binding cassette domain-containing protein [Pseudonocardia sulfidoxydans]GEL21258.1 daunorubicin resistance protein DrrA family ABC transporter ATP-binding protein [Pseudonocardia sulfidoxydans NBRC 16205]
MHTAIQAEALVKRYGDVTALDGLTVDVAPGTVFGLLGPNGAGKSTTVKVLTTLTRPDSGTATVAGHDVAAEPAQVRRNIGVVTQRAATDPQATGRENLVLAGRLQGLSGAEARTRADALLARFGVADAAGRVVRTWSGGMARKLDVAMGLVHRPPVLFLDEPTTGLDPQARADLWTEIAALARDEGTTVLLTTHYLEEADQLAERVAIVDHGRVVATGTPDALKSDLRGDTVVVGLAPSDDPSLAAAVLHRAGVGDVTTEGRALRARVDDGAQAVPGLLAALERGGVSVAAISVARPSLDDVYLRLTGRTLAEVAA